MKWSKVGEIEVWSKVGGSTTSMIVGTPNVIAGTPIMKAGLSTVITNAIRSLKNN